MTSIVIVGGGLGALRTATNLRRRGYDDRIVVVSEERHLPYNRPPLSKELLLGKMNFEELAFGLGAEHEDIEWRLSSKVVGSDFEAHTVTLDDGQTLRYDGLVVATGVASRRLDIPGTQEGRLVLRDVADAQKLMAAMNSGARLVILGAGFIGCEVARTARALGCEVDLVAIDHAPMQIPLGESVGWEIRRRHEQAGLRFHLGRTIAETVGAERIEEVVLDDGTRLAADFVLETVGSVPNTSWLAGNGLDLANGVLTDEYLRAGGVRGAVVVGDVARFANPMFGAPPMRIEHWQTAVDTAAFASATVLHDLDFPVDEPSPVSIVPWFWSDQGDVRLTSYGMLSLADSTDVIDGDLSGECAIRYSNNGEPVGVLLIGMKQKAARHKRDLLRARGNL